MTLQFDAAMGALRQGAEHRSAGERLTARLDDIQRFLQDDLEAVESIIGRLAADGPEPAVASALHLVERGGKRIRPLALVLAARCFGARIDARQHEMAAVVELVHSATLLHDDVVDEGMERRGAATARLLHGNAVSVLSGDLLLVNALGRTSEVAPELLPELIETLRRLVDGEIVQLRGRTELDTSETTYRRILQDKTASLFAFATRAGARLAEAPRPDQSHLASFGEFLGIAFQLVDDVIDYEGGESGKTLHADLLEGKMTLPLVLAIAKDPTLRDLVGDIHRGKTQVVDEVSRRVVASGSCDVTRARARDYTDRALAALEQVPPSPAREFLRIVAREMTQRVH